MNTNIKTKKMIINALLLAIGVILHQITPSLGVQMQPDFALTMLFIIMLINEEDYKSSLIAGIITGIFTALTTKFPGGQVPNVIEKIITANFVFIIIIFINKIRKIKFLSDKITNNVKAIVILPLGTLISGSIFLYLAKILVGLPASFSILFVSVVIPTIIINTIVGVFLYGIVNLSIKRIALNYSKDVKLKL